MVCELEIMANVIDDIAVFCTFLCCSAEQKQPVLGLVFWVQISFLFCAPLCHFEWNVTPAQE
jgi:hypothetical protein